jgi:hypothetical protein
VDFAQDLDAFSLGDTFKHGLADPLLVKLAVDECKVPALVFEALGLVDIGWMIVPMQEQGYWCLPVFGHDEVDYAVALAVIGYLAPTVRATKQPPAMAPKRASSKAAPSIDEAAKAALLAEKKGKALVDTTHQEACEDDALSKRQRNEQPTPEGSLRTCSSGGQPQPPPGFAPPEGADATEDGEVISVSAR